MKQNTLHAWSGSGTIKRDSNSIEVPRALSPIFTPRAALLLLSSFGICFEARAKGRRASMTPLTHSAEMKSPMAWIGGKNREADRLIGMFPTHITFCETFAGGAQVLCRKP